MQGIHVFLSEKASQNMLKASGSLNRSVGEIVNIILENIESAEVEQTISIRVRKGDERISATLTVDKRRRRYVLDF